MIGQFDGLFSTVRPTSHELYLSCFPQLTTFSIRTIRYGSCSLPVDLGSFNLGSSVSYSAIYWNYIWSDMPFSADNPSNLKWLKNALIVTIKVVQFQMLVDKCLCDHGTLFSTFLKVLYFFLSERDRSYTKHFHPLLLFISFRISKTHRRKKSTWSQVKEAIVALTARASR